MNKNIYGVYFICCYLNYIDIVEEQMNILNKGLLNITKKLIIFITMFDNDNNKTLINLINKYNKNNNINIITTKENLYEKFAINNFKNSILEKNYYIYYFHTKGLKKNNDKLFNIYSSRRKILNFYTLEKFNINIKLLEKYDAIGCSLSLYPLKHFSGNFWWSKSEYINTLKLPISNKYLSPEMFILSNNNCKYISLSNKTNNFLYEKYTFRSDENIINNITTDFIIIQNHKKLLNLC